MENGVPSGVAILFSIENSIKEKLTKFEEKITSN